MNYGNIRKSASCNEAISYVERVNPGSVEQSVASMGPDSALMQLEH